MRQVRRAGPAVVAVALVVGALAVFEPSILTSTARSPRAIGLLALIAVATSAARRIATRRWGRRAGRFMVAVAICGATWLLAIPALRQTTLNEALPVADTATTRGSAARPPEPMTRQSAADAAPAPRPTSGSPMTTATPPPFAPEEADVEAREPRRLTTGPLEGIDHEASGTVTTFALADGSGLIRFEQVDIRGAPDPVLYLVPGAGKRTRDGGTRVGALKATKGSFNHAVPAGFDLDQPFTVFVWCGRFAVPIANADQAKV